MAACFFFSFFFFPFFSPNFFLRHFFVFEMTLIFLGSRGRRLIVAGMEPRWEVEAHHLGSCLPTCLR